MTTSAPLSMDDLKAAWDRLTSPEYEEALRERQIASAMVDHILALALERGVINDEEYLRICAMKCLNSGGLLLGTEMSKRLQGIAIEVGDYWRSGGHNV